MGFPYFGDEESGDDYNDTGDDAESGALAVDEAMAPFEAGARHRQKRGGGRRKPKRVGFLQEVGVQGPAYAAGPAGPGNATYRAQEDCQLKDWICANPAGAVLANQWTITAITVGNYPQLLGGGPIAGTSHAAGVMGRFVGYIAADKGQDVNWQHFYLDAAAVVGLILNCKFKIYKRLV